MPVPIFCASDGGVASNQQGGKGEQPPPIVQSLRAQSTHKLGLQRQLSTADIWEQACAQGRGLRGNGCGIKLDA